MYESLKNTRLGKLCEDIGRMLFSNNLAKCRGPPPEQLLHTQVPKLNVSYPLGGSERGRSCIFGR